MDDDARLAQIAAIRRYLLAAADKLGIAPSALAERAGLAPSTLNRVLNNPRHKFVPSMTTLRKVARAAGIPLPADVAGGIMPVEAGMGDRGQRPPGRGRLSGNIDLPVRGNARAGREGIFMDNGDTQAFIERPWFMLGANSGYAVYVADGSMGPLIKHRQIAYVDPSQPVAIDDVVIIQLTDGQAFIKVYKGVKRGKVLAAQTNPPKELEWPQDQVASVHFVMSVLFART